MKLADLSPRDRAKLKHRMMIEQGRKCAYCDTRMSDEPRDHLHFATFDHIVSLSEGGPDTLDNLTLACKPCNTAKGSKTADELRSLADRIDYLVAACKGEPIKVPVGNRP
jgi:5-methylcytosine-specific restriction endonuclease McrA